MNTLLKKYRLLLALTTGFLVLALQGAGASSASAATFCDAPPDHASCYVAGNEAVPDGAGPYREATVEFKVPTVYGPPTDTVLFQAELGGDPKYVSGQNWLGVVGGIQSGRVSGSLGSQPQVNVPVYEVFGSVVGTQGWRDIAFSGTISAGDVIDVDVRSNLNSSGRSVIDITDTTTNKTAEQIVDGTVSDGKTGGCFAERAGNADATQSPIPQWTKPVTLSKCSISAQQNGTITTHNVGNWAHTWNHLVNSSNQILVSVGAFITGSNNADFPLTWVQGQ